MSDVARITANFPIELQALAQWVVWKFEQRPGEKNRPKFHTIRQPAPEPTVPTHAPGRPFLMPATYTRAAGLMAWALLLLRMIPTLGLTLTGAL
jgi:hypothetical protein